MLVLVGGLRIVQPARSLRQYGRQIGSVPLCFTAHREVAFQYFSVSVEHVWAQQLKAGRNSQWCQTLETQLPRRSAASNWARIGWKYVEELLEAQGRITDPCYGAARPRRGR
jgi:hypothetical protein